MKKKLRWVLLCGLLLGSSALVSNHFAQQGPGDPNPIAWSHRDIGSVTQAGTFSQTGPVAVIAGSGSDIWGTADAFHFAYVPWTGRRGVCRADRHPRQDPPVGQGGDHAPC